MKTTFLLLTSLFLLTTIYAQEEPDFGFKKEDFFISGTINYKNSETKNTNSTSETNEFQIQPEIGYFVGSNLALGTRLGYLTGEQKSRGNNVSNTVTDLSGYSLGAFARYFIHPQKRFSIYADLSVGYTFTKNETESPGSSNQLNTGVFETEVKAYDITLSPGINFFISEKLSITSRIGGIRYLDQEFTAFNSLDSSEIKREDNEFSIDLDFNNISFGILYNI